MNRQADRNALSSNAGPSRLGRALLVGAMLCASTTTACGGPVPHKIKMSAVPADKRAELDESSQAVDAAQVGHSEAEHQKAEADKKWNAAKAAAKKSEHDVKIAKAKLDHEKAKKNGGESGDPKTAKAELEQAKRNRKIAHAEEALAAAKYELAAETERLAEAEWELALARYQSEKAERAPDDPKLEKKKEKIQLQLEKKQKQAEQRAADVESAKAGVKKAEDRLADTKDR